MKVDLGALGPVREAAIAALGGDVRAATSEASGQQVSFSVPAEVLSTVILVHSGTGVIEEARHAEQLPLIP